MYIESIELTNWKCFKHKKVEFDKNINLLRWPNGSGKSSLIEAIIFALFNKRPLGLSFNDLRNDVDQNCKIILKFHHMMSDYAIECEFGSASSYLLYKDGELISRTRSDNKKIIETILPEVVMSGLWGYESLAQSPVLNTNYLYDIMETEFSEPLTLKKYFQGERTFHQKNVSSLKKVIQNQTVSQEDVDAIKEQIDQIEEELKRKTFISDSDYLHAKRCEDAQPKYDALKTQLESMPLPSYDIDTSRRLFKIGVRSSEDWINYFKNIRAELTKERSKATEVHPLATYPRSVVDRLIRESEKSGRCVCCGKPYDHQNIDFDTVDSRKIENLENKLKDEQYDFDLLSQSIRWYQVEKKVNDFKFVVDTNWKETIKKYDKNVSSLYDKRDELNTKYASMQKDFAKISELLNHQKEYDDAKECIDIVDEYIENAKMFYADSLTTLASDILKELNPRYNKIIIEEGAYKAYVSSTDYSTQSLLNVQSLSMGEKTMVALSLILAFCRLFVPDIPLIMDESFSNLDADNLSAINNLINKEQNQWIIVSHDERIQLLNTI